jgi:hypothetical protein
MRSLVRAPFREVDAAGSSSRLMIVHPASGCGGRCTYLSISLRTGAVTASGDTPEGRPEYVVTQNRAQKSMLAWDSGAAKPAELLRRLLFYSGPVTCKTVTSVVFAGNLHNRPGNGKRPLQY